VTDASTLLAGPPGRRGRYRKRRGRCGRRRFTIRTTGRYWTGPKMAASAAVVNLPVVRQSCTGPASAVSTTRHRKRRRTVPDEEAARLLVLGGGGDVPARGYPRWPEAMTTRARDRHIM